MERFTDVDLCVDKALETVGKEVVLALPLGLGKPNQLVNAFYRRALNDPSITLRILTALSLEKPTPKNEIEAKFLIPFVERLFGDYEELEYTKALRGNSLPDNISISEFYFKAGAMKKVPLAQQNYISTNYTFAARDLMLNGANVLAQMVAERDVDGQTRLSLSSNTDVTLDMMPIIQEERAKGRKILTIGQVHDEMPFMYNRAMVEPDYFDMVVANPAYNTTLFAPPNLSVPPADYLAGFYASSLVKDGGTLQIGIGSLGDAIVYALIMRQQDNASYRAIAGQLDVEGQGGESVDLQPFQQGIYGSSEMFVNGFMHLIKNNIVRRRVYDDLVIQTLLNEGRISEAITPDTLQYLMDSGAVNRQLSPSDVEYLRHWGVLSEAVSWQQGQVLKDGKAYDVNLDEPAAFEALTANCLGEELCNGIYMHGGFFLGPQDFYQALREMPREQSEGICMSSVGHINQLDTDRELLSAQRRDARFINTGMMVTLSGAVVSDGLEDGTVVSGVGGQYNFVAMAHNLPGARSILCVRSTRKSKEGLVSNIVPHYGHITIPRHLRDIVVTEYGIADLRAKTDEQVAIELLKVADSRFQDELLATAKAAGKVRQDYQLPKSCRNNTPERVAELMADWKGRGRFPAFPLGTDFTEQEIALGKSLKDIKALMEQPKDAMRAIIRSFVHQYDEEKAQPFLERIQLEHPETTKEYLLQHLLLLELEENGYFKTM